WVKAIRFGIDKTIQEIRRSGDIGLAERMSKVVSGIGKAPLDRGSNWSISSTTGVNPAVLTELRAWYRDPQNWKGVCNHDTRSHMREDLHRYLFCACFGKQYYSTSKFTPKASEFPATLAPDHINWNSGDFVDRFRVQNARR